jgi:hypothetical protein
MNIQSTTNYGLFLSPTIQRDTSLPKIEKLKQSMRERGFWQSNPIVVRQDGRQLRIIKGQHRYQAARELGSTLYYVVDNSMTDEDAPDFDPTTWSKRDVVDAFAGGGNPHYKYLHAFAEKHGISYQLAVTLLMGNVLAGEGKWREDFNSGKFEVLDADYACRIIEMAKWFSIHIKWWNEVRLVTAIAAVANLKGIDMALLKRRIQSNGAMISKKRTQEDYVKMIEDIYNFRTQAKDQLNIHFLYRQELMNRKVKSLEKVRTIRMSNLETKRKGLLSFL